MGLHGSLIWYELMTSDADAARAFYQAVVGWTIDAQGSNGGGHKGYRMIAMPDGAVGGLLPLTEAMIGHGAKPAWLFYIHVSDVEEAVAGIEKAGGRTLMAPWDTPGIGRFAMVADPHGAPFYVMDPIPPAGGGESTSFDPKRLGRCAWNEHRAPDLAAAVDFYTSHFGWVVSGSMPMGALGDYMFLSHGAVPIGAAFPAGDSDLPAWIHYFRVPDIGKAAAAIGASGGTLLQQPHEVPGGDHVLIARDPQGAVFALVA